MYAINETPRPRWGWLYGVVAVMGGLLVVIEVTMPDGLARRVLECVVAVAMLGAMAVWVRVSRVALALAEHEVAPARRPAIVPRRPGFRGEMAAAPVRLDTPRRSATR